jgi:hypothetical protein
MPNWKSRTGTTLQQMLELELLSHQSLQMQLRRFSAASSLIQMPLMYVVCSGKAFLSYLTFLKRQFTSEYPHAGRYSLKYSSVGTDQISLVYLRPKKGDLTAIGFYPPILGDLFCLSVRPPY